MLHAIDRDHNLIHVPLVVRAWAIAAETSGKVRPKSIDPKAYRFTADNDATHRQKILDISRTQREAMVTPDSLGHYLTWKTKALQAGHGRRDRHA